MAKDKENHQWLGHKIKAPEHARDLERKAAIYEFDHKLNRVDAEKRAYTEYLQDQHAEAAAHHLHGMKMARAAGDNEISKQHADLYGLHIKALGGSPSDPVPPEVKAFESALRANKPVKFKVHQADQLLVTDK